MTAPSSLAPRCRAESVVTQGVEDVVAEMVRQFDLVVGGPDVTCFTDEAAATHAMCHHGCTTPMCADHTEKNRAWLADLDPRQPIHCRTCHSTSVLPRDVSIRPI